MANSLLRVRNGASTSDNCMYSFPEICSSVSCQIRTLEMGSLSRFEPLFLLRLLPPDQAWPFFAILHPPLSLRSAACGSESWMRPRFRSILKLAFGNPRLQSSKCFFDLGHKATPDGLLFIHPSGRAAQVIGLFASRNLDLLDLHFWSHPFVIILEQFLFKLLQFAARGTHQILSAALADGHPVLFTHHATIEDPDPCTFPC